ncbi:MAG TPA: family 20 glycosylhydrolase [Terracidiphilus sp.]|nr:family 20 glycosylhydrolase [Terracidiphilus sp.]
MRKAAACAAVLCAAAVAAGQTNGGAEVFRNTLMPEPASLTVQPGSFAITPATTFGLTTTHDAMLEQATVRAIRRMEAMTGVQLSTDLPTGHGQALIEIDVEHPAEAVQTLDEDESYQLVVQEGSVALTAPNDLGALHGLQTLLQLVQRTSQGYLIPDVSIADKPRFQWRGLMIDCGRHFEPVPVLLRTLDAMEAVKLNVLHLHLSEDQGFRVESKRFPKLQEMGSDGLYYTQEQIREIVAYAHARGIRVVPEFDMPGHSTSWFVGYPELASAPGPYHIERVFGIHDAAMDPTRESTYKFLDAFLGEMAGLFPDAYMHIGGDESNGKEWMANPKIRAFMQAHGIADAAGLQVYFNQHLLKILTKYHKHMVGWDEIMTPGLPKDVAVQSWRGVESLAKGATEGYRGILSAPYYLDGMHTAEFHYLADPIPADTRLTPAQQKLILGGEVCMWGEQISPQTIDSRIWPRTAAIAERFWSPAAVSDVPDMYRRLGVENLRLDALGVEQISGPERMQRQLWGKRRSSAFRVFTSVIEPVSFGDRYDLQHTDQLTPLDGLADAVTPDPPVRHEMEEAVQALLKDPRHQERGRARLGRWFAQWERTSPALAMRMEASPQLAPYAGQANELADLGALGTEALEYLRAPGETPGGWRDRALKKIADLKAEKSLVQYAFLDSLEALVSAVPAAPAQ